MPSTSWSFFLPRRLRREPRTTDRFSVPQVVDWLDTTTQAGHAPVLPAEYCSLRSEVSDPSSGALLVLKHDIHRELEPALTLAREEARRGLRATFFAMHQHELNAEWFTRPHTGHVLAEIQALGHEIGLHVDLLQVALESRDLYETLARQADYFRAMGLQIECANCHGNSGLRHHGVVAMQLLAENAPRDTSGASDEALPHVSRYSLAEIAQRIGIEYWVDGRIQHLGAPIGQPLLLTDNTGAMRIPKLGIESCRFRLDSGFCRQAAEALPGHDALILLHPQHYA